MTENPTSVSAYEALVARVNQVEESEKDFALIDEIENISDIFKVPDSWSHEKMVDLRRELVEKYSRYVDLKSSIEEDDIAERLELKNKIRTIENEIRGLLPNDKQ